MTDTRSFIFDVVAQGVVPQYLSGMADWSTRALTPSQGLPQARYVYPTYWRNGSTGGVPLHFAEPTWPDYGPLSGGPPSSVSLSKIYNTDFYLAGAQPSQSGAVFDPTRKRLWFHGGGHAAGPFNGLFYFDFNGDAAPVGWVYCTGSDSDPRYQADPANYELTFPGNPGTINYYVPWAGQKLDKPMSVHTANQHVFVPSRNRYYRFGGATFGKGQVADTSAFYWDVAAARWFEIPAFQNYDTQFPADARLSPDESKVFVWSNYGDFFVRLADAAANHAIVPARPSLMPDTQPNPVACLNEDTGEYLVLAYGNSGDRSLANYIPVRGWTEAINWTAETATATVATLNVPTTTYQDPNAFSPLNAAMFYDRGNACFWVLGDRPAGLLEDTQYLTPLRHLWKVVRNSASSYTFTKVTLPTPLSWGPTSPLVAGLHGRWAWFEEWRTLMVYWHNYNPMYAIRIPVQ